MNKQETPNGCTLAAWLERHAAKPDCIKARTVYGVKHRNASDHTVITGRITKKGREYITTDLYGKTRFRVRDPEDPFLIEADSDGLVDLLFLDKPALDEYICQKQRASEFRSKTDAYCAGSSSWQLFAAMSVLEHASELTCKVILNLIQDQIERNRQARKLHSARLAVPESKIRKYGRLMSAGTVDYDKKQIGIYSILEKWTVPFGDGLGMTVQVRSGYDGQPPWIEAALYRNGERLADTFVEHTFPKKIAIKHDGETYAAEIVQKQPRPARNDE